ncbi:hypothetical protein SprV_0902698100 [Sparganum proliferum]
MLQAGLPEELKDKHLIHQCCPNAQIIKAILALCISIGFLVVALIGVLLKASAPFVKSLLNKALSFGGKIDDEQVNYLTNFILENSTGVSVILIVVGLALATLCFVGVFASCYACEILLKIYAIILVVLLVAQIVAVAVLFSNPTKLTQSIDTAMTELLKHFNKTTEVGKASSAIWMFTMTFNGTCCGMDGAEDFQNISSLTDYMGLCFLFVFLLKYINSTINVVLGIGFLVVALIGVLLKASAPFVKSLLNKALSFGGKIDDEQVNYLTNFILENSTGVSVILIVVGLALATLCFVGVFASCYACEILLKIYAIILVVLLVAQIVAVAVLFSNPTKLTQSIDTAMTELLKHFNKTTEVGKASSAIWMFTMTFNGTCCGMDGAEDFQNISSLTDAPAPCCTNSQSVCTITDAKTANVTGCRERINTFTYDNLKVIMYVAIAAIVLQGFLLIFVGFAICL